MGFLSKAASTGNGNGRVKYTLAEDQVICEGLEANETVAQIEARLKAAGHVRPTLSVQYRVNLLKKNAPLYASLEDFHAKRPIPVEPEVEDVEETEVEVEDEDEEDEFDELDDLEEELEEVE